MSCLIVIGLEPFNETELQDKLPCNVVAMFSLTEKVIHWCRMYINMMMDVFLIHIFSFMLLHKVRSH